MNNDSSRKRTLLLASLAVLLSGCNYQEQLAKLTGETQTNPTEAAATLPKIDLAALAEASRLPVSNFAKACPTNLQFNSTEAETKCREAIRGVIPPQISKEGLAQEWKTHLRQAATKIAPHTLKFHEATVQWTQAAYQLQSKGQNCTKPRKYLCVADEIRSARKRVGPEVSLYYTAVSHAIALDRQAGIDSTQGKLDLLEATVWSFNQLRDRKFFVQLSKDEKEMIPTEFLRDIKTVGEKTARLWKGMETKKRDKLDVYLLEVVSGNLSMLRAADGIKKLYDDLKKQGVTGEHKAQFLALEKQVVPPNGIRMPASK
jgi:hypothetical protein